MIEADYVVIGAGIAGAAVAFELSGRGRTLLLEREDHPGYHATGRSAAMLMQTYGDETTRALTKASIPFLENPPDTFAADELLKPRGGLWLRSRENGDDDFLQDVRESGCAVVTELDGKQVLDLVPILRPEFTTHALFEPDAREIDVHQLLTGYLKGLRKRGGQLITRQEVIKLDHRSRRWTIEAQAERYSAPVVVNAAGAWGDAIAVRAGVEPLGLIARRRTAFTFGVPEGLDHRRWPFTVETRESFYFTPEAGSLLGSPVDEAPVPPADVQAEEYDVAVGVERIENATTLRIRNIRSKWAGLRTFTIDGYPAVGLDSRQEGFVWLVGQGGSGVMTAPALARYCAALAAGEPAPPEFAANGLNKERLSPARFDPEL